MKVDYYTVMYFWVFFFVKNVLHTVSVYLLEFFSLYIFHFVILCCFSVTHVYVAFPFLVGSCNCWRKNFFFLFLFLFYCQYYITVQICVDMKKTIFGGQFKYRYIETLVYKLLVSIVGLLRELLRVHKCFKSFRKYIFAVFMLVVTT